MSARALQTWSDVVRDYSNAADGPRSTMLTVNVGLALTAARMQSLMLRCLRDNPWLYAQIPDGDSTPLDSEALARRRGQLDPGT